MGSKRLTSTMVGKMASKHLLLLLLLLLLYSYIPSNISNLLLCFLYLILAVGGLVVSLSEYEIIGLGSILGQPIFS